MKNKIFGCFVCSFLTSLIMVIVILFVDGMYEVKYGYGLIQEIVRGW